MKITNNALSQLKGNNKAIGRLMVAFNRGQKSIEVWMRNKDVRLTTPDAVRIIAEETGIPVQDVVSELEHEDTLSK